MAALDFPASPTNGQVYNNWTYNSTKGVWQSSPYGQQQAAVSSTPPLTPAQGDLWYDPDDGSMYIYYSDGDSSQWVQTRSDVSISSTIGPNVDSLLTRSPNFLINGGMDIWQRGTTAVTATGTYAADRWFPSWSAGTASVTQSTDVPSNFQYSISVAGTNTTGLGITQRIEAQNAALIANQSVTLSVWAKSSVGTNALAWATSYPAATADTFSSVTADTSGTFAATMTVGSWTRYSATFTTNALATRGYQINISRTATTTSTTTLYTGIQLEKGSQMGAFRRSAPSIQAELAACQRYYYRATTGDLAFYGLAYAVSSSAATLVFSVGTAMRVNPNPGFSNVKLYLSGSYFTLSSISCDGGPQSLSLTLSPSTTISAGSIYRVIGSGTSCYLDFSAEL